MTEPADWYYVENKRQFGPHSAEELRRWVAEGQLSPRVLVWREGMADWQPFAESPLAAEAGALPQAGPPPIPAEAAATASEPPPRPGVSEGRPMDLPEAVRHCFREYVTFSGRAARSEFWWFTLFCWLVSIAATGVDAAAAGGWEASRDVLGSLWGLATFLPGLAVSARRLHDTDRSGWWLLLYLVPLIGWIVLVVFWCQRGTAGRNRFG